MHLSLMWRNRICLVISLVTYQSEKGDNQIDMDSIIVVRVQFAMLLLMFFFYYVAIKQLKTKLHLAVSLPRNFFLYNLLFNKHGILLTSSYTSHSVRTWYLKHLLLDLYKYEENSNIVLTVMTYFIVNIGTFYLLIVGYRISWEEFNRTNTRVTHYLPNLTQEYRVTGLTALTTYTIQVAAMTSKGQGQLSSSTISSGVPPG